MSRCFTKPEDFSGRDFYLDTDSGGNSIIRSKPDVIANDETGSNAPIGPLTPTTVPPSISDGGIVIEYWDDLTRYWLYDGTTPAWSIIKDRAAGSGLTSVDTDATLTGDGTPGNPLSVDKTGDWTGTFDGQDGAYYLDYNNLSNKPAVLSWNTVTILTTNMVGNNGYITDYGGGGSAVLNLPAASDVGAMISIVGKGGSGWQINQAVGQRIYFEQQSTTSGVSGNISSSHFGDSIEMVCITANTEWRVINSVSKCINVT